MKNSGANIELEKLREELKVIADKRKTATQEEDKFLFGEHRKITGRIAEIEWLLKSPDEKQEYRKSIVNLGNKWGSMRGSVQPDKKNRVTLEYIIELYDLSSEILKREDLSENIKGQIRNLLDEINVTRP